MGMIPIDWYSQQHRWALIRHYRNRSDTNVVSQHTNPHAAVLQCLKWNQDEPFAHRNSNGGVDHWYQVIARDEAAERRMADEEAAACRAGRRPPNPWFPPSRDRCLRSKIQQWAWLFAADRGGRARWRLTPEQCFRSLLTASPPRQDQEEMESVLVLVLESEMQEIDTIPSLDPNKIKY